MPANGDLTIGQLAGEAGVPTSTLRYYERVGLLEPDSRSAGNYRLYGEASLERLRFIRAAQAVGFTLDDVRELVVAGDPRDARCASVRRLLEQRLDEVEERLRDLEHVRGVLESALAECRGARPNAKCRVVANL